MKQSCPSPTAREMLQFCNPSIVLDSERYKKLDDVFRACKVSPREIPRIYKASNTLFTLLRSNMGSRGREAAYDIVFMLTSMRFRLTSVYNSYINGESDWNVFHWDERQSFWAGLSYFFPFVSKTINECTEEWSDVISQRNTNTEHDEWKKDMACIGRAIYYCTHVRDSDSFGYCLSRFMEQVYI